MEELKENFLELLERDKEFRYAVAGYLALYEVLKRLDVLAEEQAGLRKEQIRLAEEQAGLRKEQTKIWKEIAGLREEQAGLREDFNKMFKVLDLRLSRVERTLEKLTVDVEDEARSFVRHRLGEIGIGLELTSLILPDFEINLYGVSDDVCVVGEASVRASTSLVDELLEKLEKLKKDYPDRLRKRVILVIYVSLPMVELVERVKRENIWLLKATEEFYRPEKLFLEL